MKQMAAKRKDIPIREILKAAHQSCKQCGTKEKLTVDHIIPLAAGGTNEASNLQFLCENCQDRRHGHIPKRLLR
jgi:5-methylcytosine-specific restriction endonuclease McrA